MKTKFTILKFNLLLLLFTSGLLNESSAQVIVQNLNLTSVCSDDPTVQRSWRVTNPNSFSVNFTWEVFNNQQTGSGVAAPGFTYFSTNTIPNSPNTTIIRWFDQNNVQHQVTKASGGQTCPCQVTAATSAVNNLICAGESATLTANVTGNAAAPYSFQWTPSGSGNPLLVSPLATTNYSVTATNGLATCSTTVSLSVNNCVPLTQLRSSDCGKLTFVKNSFVFCVAVPGATSYNWEIRDISGTTVLGTISTTGNWCFLNQLYPGIQYATQYQIRTSAVIAPNVGVFGPACTIGLICDPAICGVPITQIRSVDCNKFNYRLATGRIIADYVPGGIQYEFEFRDINTNALVASKTQNLNTLFLNTVSGLTLGQYNVSARVRMPGGLWGPFGSACPIGISSSARESAPELEEENVTDELGNVMFTKPIFKLNSNPNPFQESINVNVQSDTQEIVQIRIFDLSGRIVEQTEVVTLENIVLGLNLEAGIYLMEAQSRSGKQTTTRLVKSK